MSEEFQEKGIKYFKPGKLRSLFLLSFLGGALVAFSIPFLIGKTNGAFTLGGILFFIIPLLCLTIYKGLYVSEGSITIGSNFLLFTESDQETRIGFEEIASFSIKLIGRNFAGLTYSITLILKEGNKFDFFLVENDLFDSNNTISSNSILYAISSSFRKFNDQYSVKDGNAIRLSNKSKMPRYAWLLFSIPLIAVLLDIYYRTRHPDSSMKEGVFLVIMSFFLSLALLAKVKGYSNFGSKVEAILND